MVYIKYKGKKDGEYIFSVKKIGRVEILYETRRRGFFDAMFATIKNAFSFQFFWLRLHSGKL